MPAAAYAATINQTSSVSERRRCGGVNGDIGLAAYAVYADFAGAAALVGTKKRRGVATKSGAPLFVLLTLSRARVTSKCVGYGDSAL